MTSHTSTLPPSPNACLTYTTRGTPRQVLKLSGSFPSPSPPLKRQSPDANLTFGPPTRARSPSSLSASARSSSTPAMHAEMEFLRHRRSSPAPLHLNRADTPRVFGTLPGCSRGRSLRRWEPARLAEVLFVLSSDAVRASAGQSWPLARGRPAGLKRSASGARRGAEDVARFAGIKARGFRQRVLVKWREQRGVGHPGLSDCARLVVGGRIGGDLFSGGNVEMFSGIGS
ncbi:hypothetical protein GJ744_010995 [Endocarpon pusillum]|uniref:Uncharacterized protein n=1 Tax=Endocarpon pusillum TaxID=364733 RepID=A0A8H7AHF3_9EURO|nr:hypothetical protein GJ744_010995 [Endocarpon pusillum]